MSTASVSSPNSVNTISWLVRREFWEHKGWMLWAPAVLGAVTLAIAVALIIYGHSSGVLDAQALGSGAQVHPIVTVNGKALIVATSHAEAMYVLAAVPLSVLLAAALLFYCVGSLHDERADRSLLFWKSLPVSNLATVLSKLIAAVLVAPAIMVAVSVVTALAAMMLGVLLFAFQGVDLVKPLVLSPGLYLTPLSMFALIPVYALWALPVVGWLLMVSSWAPSKPLLWATAVPAVAGLLLHWMHLLSGVGMRIDDYMEHVLARGFGTLVPGAWFAFGNVHPRLFFSPNGVPSDLSGAVTQSYAGLAAPSLWIGVLLGAAFIAVAVRLRRWRE